MDFTLCGMVFLIVNLNYKLWISNDVSVLIIDFFFIFIDWVVNQLCLESIVACYVFIVYNSLAYASGSKEFLLKALDLGTCKHNH